MNGDKQDFRWLKGRRLPFNFRLVFLHRTPALFVAARSERPKVSGKPDEYNEMNEQEGARGEERIMNDEKGERREGNIRTSV